MANRQQLLADSMNQMILNVAVICALHPDAVLQTQNHQTATKQQIYHNMCCYNCNKVLACSEVYVDEIT